ncbi:MAG: hypothetical protein KF878_24915 [Planctomycetes bacterium]|nr:hypothetical protein [Planctomycetota bacterium]
MLRAPVHFSTTRFTPAAGPGLTLTTPEPEAGWVFGALVIDDHPSQAAAWARALVLHAYADEEPAVRVSPVVVGRHLLIDPPASGALTLAFAADAGELLGLEGGWFLTATARHHTSAPLHLRARGPRPEALGEPSSPAEAAILARTCLRAGDVQRADALFGAALADDTVRVDPGAGVVYDAACAAARVAAQASDQARHAAGARALTLLRDDLQRRQRAVAARTQQHILAALDGPPDDLDGLLGHEIEHLRWARDEDPDLAHLRATSAFAALFRPARARGATAAYPPR